MNEETKPSAQLGGQPISWEVYREIVGQMAFAKSEWAGLPMPIPGEELVMEARYPFKGIEEVTRDMEAEAKAEAAAPKWINSWFSHRLRTYVVVTEEKESGRRGAGYFVNNGADKILRTLAGCYAWTEDMEIKALTKLQELLTPWLFKCYLMTGCFPQTSQRSGVHYIFRKLRPTLAIRNGKLICALCMHPIGYYKDSWAGVMTPTDDVIAHYTLMKGDEKLFWKRANQIPITYPEAGL